MPYKEGKDQAFLYYDLGKRALERGNRGEAINYFNQARTIAVENNMPNLIRLIDDVLADMQKRKQYLSCIF